MPFDPSPYLAAFIAGFGTGAMTAWIIGNQLDRRETAKRLRRRPTSVEEGFDPYAKPFGEL